MYTSTLTDRMEIIPILPHFSWLRTHSLSDFWKTQLQIPAGSIKFHLEIYFTFNGLVFIKFSLITVNSHKRGVKHWTGCLSLSITVLSSHTANSSRLYLHYVVKPSTESTGTKDFFVIFWISQGQHSYPKGLTLQYYLQLELAKMLFYIKLNFF